MLPQSGERSRQVGQVVVTGEKVFEVGQFPEGWRQTLHVVLTEVQHNQLFEIAKEVWKEAYLVSAEIE